MIYKGKYKVSQIYKGASHKGIDLVGLDSKEIYSPIDGEVMAARVDTHPTGGMGQYVKIKDSEGKRHLFAHLSRFYVKPGQSIKKGEKIGTEGNTGHSFGSHLHYEIRKTDNSASFVDVAAIMGIPNKLGVYEGDGDMTKEEAKRIVKEKAGLSDKTIEYIADHYRFGDDLIKKLAAAMQ